MLQGSCYVKGNVEHPEEGGEIEVVHGHCQEEAGHGVEVPGEHVGQEGAVGPNKSNGKGGEVFPRQVLQFGSNEGNDKVEEEADEGDAQTSKCDVPHDWRKLCLS